jgi:hypothetical protein
VAALKAQILNSPDAQALDQAVVQNSQMLADVVEAMYPGRREQFLPLWQSHIDYYKGYVAATLEEDDDAKGEARQNLAQFAEDLAALLAEANPAYNRSDLANMIGEHGTQVTSIVDALAAEDYDTAVQLMHDANEHMGQLAESLSVV